MMKPAQGTAGSLIKVEVLASGAELCHRWWVEMKNAVLVLLHTLKVL